MFSNGVCNPFRRPGFNGVIMDRYLAQICIKLPAAVHSGEPL